MSELYESYLALASNPFYIIDTAISDQSHFKFHKSLQSLADSLKDSGD